ncbi:CHAT domain-containing protein [Nonomuraea sp. PA05]|uniref:CHAT domain-containing tetratricopeptide repeat protein n=1 Tax=Nonomuraea sp. PA05 TaxID=2604466 RepID=UPI0011D855D9|nr:CHAT domain-containing protein [Nonomuraea sp. PA05]TYB66626.1 CHAT domain-containing protein [Nonomuraea sp. PA05]
MDDAMTDGEWPDWRAHVARFAEPEGAADRDRDIEALTTAYYADEADEEQLDGLAVLLLARYRAHGAAADRDTAAAVLDRLLTRLPQDDPYGDVVAGTLGELLAEAGTCTPEVAALLERGLAKCEGHERIAPLYFHAICLSAGTPAEETLQRLTGDLGELLGLLPEDHPMRPEVMIRLADSLAGGDPGQAITLYEQAWQRMDPGPGRAQVAANLSVLIEAPAPRTGISPELEAAERWIRAALAEPVRHSAERHAHLAFLLIRRLMPALPPGKAMVTPEGLKAFSAALRERPELRAVLAEAVDHLERAERLAPDDVRINGTLAGARMVLSGCPVATAEQLDAVHRHTARVAAQHPDLPQARALELLTARDPAEEDLRAAVAALPAQDALRPQLLARLGTKLQAAGAAAEAMRVLVPALPALPPDDPVRAVAMAALIGAVLDGVRLHTSRAELDRLAEDLRAVAPDGPQDAATHLAWGVVHAVRGIWASSRADFDTATASFNRAIDLLPATDPNVAGLRYAIAMTMVDRFSVDKDLQYLDDALEIFDELAGDPAWAESSALLIARGVARLARSLYGKTDQDRRTAMDELARGFAGLPDGSPIRRGLAPAMDAAETLSGSRFGPAELQRMIDLARGPETELIEGRYPVVDLVAGLLRLELFPGDQVAARQVLRAAADFDQRTGRFGDTFAHAATARAWWALGRPDEAIRGELAALRARLADGLLQTRASRSLAVTRDTAEDALGTASRALAGGRDAAAVEALELARGMTLYAATAGLPDEPAPDSSGRTIPVPTDVRSGAVIERAAEPGFLDPPTVPQIAAALRDHGWDALAYLLPSSAGGHGRALLVRPDGTVRTLPLPGLDGEEVARVRAYERAHQRSLSLDERAPWRAALLDLGAWAWRVVMEPLLTEIAAGRPLARVVLVPWGTLGAVPWQAAGDPASGGYVCRRAVISFAVSARQLIRTAPPFPDHHARPAIVADPGGARLRWCRWECDELSRLFYSSARRFGRWKGDEVTPVATPATLLDLLPGGTWPATLLHFGGHAESTQSPVDAKLRLAGEVTVGQLLARPRAGGPGPLVVLSACTSDFTAEDYDEALTLATALLAAGASTVIGSRWGVEDDARTALLMVMYHAFLATCDRAEALRRTQVWALAPRREDLPPGISAGLVRLAFELDLADPVIWAAFTHQGR